MQKQKKSNARHLAASLRQRGVLLSALPPRPLHVRPGPPAQPRALQPSPTGSHLQSDVSTAHHASVAECGASSRSVFILCQTCGSQCPAAASTFGGGCAGGFGSRTAGSVGSASCERSGGGGGGHESSGCPLTVTPGASFGREGGSSLATFSSPISSQCWRICRGHL